MTIAKLHINYYTVMFPVGNTSCRTLIVVCVRVCVRVCVCVRACARACVRACVRCHYATNVSNFGYEPIKFSSFKLIK